MRKNISNVNSAITYHPGWIKDQVKYKVLTIDHLPKAAMELIRATVKTLVSGDSARDFAHKDARLFATKNLQTDWAYTSLDVKGRIGVLRYRGIEVAMFFKREITEIEPGSGEKPPECQITDPVDLWQRLDIFGPSAKRANVVLTNKHQDLEEENGILKQEIDLLQVKFDKQETKLAGYIKKEDYKKQVLEEAAAEARRKARPTARKKSATDRLCSICNCYENYHEFNTKGKSLGCLGGKAKCTNCAFKPKGIRPRRKK